ncbi:TOM1-like protein 5 [Malania oleifera]|uniref:TOM1-like protein 5 n=1 Tax=Malania oleifera TaxID=397392 RepID=UPI0025AE5A15|nr:TOM1-like protein 5 [Malania oleifera]XP_057970860.1 TOM1-like protein 5 [Malania oleifera]
MAAELVNSATCEKLTEMDWTKSIEICEIVARDQRQAKDVIKAIKKRLGHKNSNTQLFAVNLLEMLMNNIGEHIHRQVIDLGLLPILVKIVKKKSDLPVRERIFLLLDATQTSLGGASGKFPQYYAAYYDLVSAGVQFPQRSRALTSNHPPSERDNIHIPVAELAASTHERAALQAEAQTIPESSIIQKASNALEVLREVLDAVTQNGEGAKDEFTLDLVEQCSFQKQRVMQLVMTSRDEKAVSRAIELNEELQKVLARHDAFLSRRSALPANNYNHEKKEEQEEEEEEEEEDAAEQLFRRIRKGKACVLPDDEKRSMEQPIGLLGSGVHRPLIRPLCLEPSHEPQPHPSAVSIPPPPARHIERARFFQESNSDGSAVADHMRGLSLHRRNTSSSHSGSMDSSD